MTDLATAKPTRKEKRQTKAAQFEALLARKSGVTLDQRGDRLAGTQLPSVHERTA